MTSAEQNLRQCRHPDSSRTDEVHRNLDVKRADQ